MLYVCGGFDGAGQLNVAERFDIDANEWSLLPSMLARRVVNAAHVIAGKLYVFGSEDTVGTLGALSAIGLGQGQDDARVASSAERFNTQSNTWEALPPMLSRRVGGAATVAAGCLYVCGGWDGRQRLHSVERFDPELEAWEEVSPMLQRRDRAAVATIAGRLFVCGGFDGDRDLSSAECFDPATGVWRMLPSMSERRSSAAAVSAAS